jgi:hypothetical protein
MWGNNSVNSGGGSWYPPSIDLDTDRVFWAVANPAPFPGTAMFPNGTSRTGDNLYSDSTLVLDVHTGKYQWHHQHIQHDLFDRDLLHTMLTEVGGVPIVVSTGNEGRVWANRRDTGEVLWGPVPVGMHKNDELTELTGSTELLPGSFGGATFQGTVIALDRATGKEVWRWKAPGGINSWMTVSGDTVVIPVGSASPAVVVALRLGDGTSTPPTAGRGAAGSGAAGSGGTGGSASTGAPTFSAIYNDILSKRCAGPVCHSGSSTGGSLNVMAGTASAVRTSLVGKAASGSECMSSGLSMVTAGQPNQSLLYLKLTDMPPCGSRMPPTGPLSAAELDQIRTWSMNGAADN